PPRNDTAQRVTWDLKEHAGKSGYLELVDGNSAGAYAWLAIGRFSPPVVKVPAIMPSQFERRREGGAELAAELKIAKLEEPLDALFLDNNASPSARSAAAKALMTLNPTAHQNELAGALGEVGQ